MVTRKATAVAFISILITAWLVVNVLQAGAQMTDEQKKTFVGEWRGVWEGFSRSSSTLIIHEIDTDKAKARCTFTDAYLGEKKYPILADFTLGPDPKLEFKLEGNEYNFILKKAILHGSLKGMSSMGYTSTTIKMEKYPKR